MKKTSYCRPVFSLFLITFIFSMCSGQDAKEIYKQNVQEYRVNAQKGTVTFLNRKLSDEDRLEPLTNIGEFSGEENINATVAIVKDPEESEVIRTAGLSKIQGRLTNDSEFARYVLGLVESNDTQPLLRNNALQSIRVLSFSTTGKPAIRDEINQTMRNLARDENEGFRKVALGWLVARKDDYGHRLILDGLQNLDNALVPVEVGVQILGLDLKNDAYPVLHKILMEPPSAVSRIEAAKLLGGYELAVDDLVKILQNSEESEEIRLVSIGTLDANQPDRFSNFVLPLLKERSTPVKLNAYSLRAEMYRRKGNNNNSQRKGADEFDLEVRRISNDSSNVVLQRLANQYLKSISPKF